MRPHTSILIPVSHCVQGAKPRESVDKHKELKIRLDCKCEMFYRGDESFLELVLFKMPLDEFCSVSPSISLNHFGKFTKLCTSSPWT